MKNALYFLCSFVVTAVMLLSLGCASPGAAAGHAVSYRNWQGPVGSMSYHRWVMLGK